MNQQRTPEWLESRIGMITGSKIADITGSVAAQKRRLGQEISELLSGEVLEIKAKPLDWGIMNESKPKAIYHAEHNEVVDCSLITHPDYPRFGCSPDGLVGDNGLIEIKCPYNSLNHIETVVKDTIKLEYRKQIQWNLFVTGREWCDFITYDPRMPLKSQMVIVSIRRDETMIEELKAGAFKFLEKLDSYMEKLV